jgi:hypothetical protein
MSANSVSNKRQETNGDLRPALASIPNACRYLGGVSRAKFYQNILTELESVKLGGRRFVTVASLDQFITSHGSHSSSISQQ